MQEIKTEHRTRSEALQILKFVIQNQKLTGIEGIYGPVSHFHLILSTRVYKNNLLKGGRPIKIIRRVRVRLIQEVTEEPKTSKYLQTSLLLFKERVFLTIYL